MVISGQLYYVYKAILTIREHPRGPRKRHCRRRRQSWKLCQSGNHIPWRCLQGICSTFCNPPDGRVCWSCRMHRSLLPQPDTWNLRRPLHNAINRYVIRATEKERKASYFFVIAILINLWQTKAEYETYLHIRGYKI